MSLKIRRGLAASRTSITPAEGEFIYTTDTKIVYIGDGTTAGGNVLSGGGANTSGYLQVSNATILFNNRLTVANSRNYLQVANSKTYLQVANAVATYQTISAERAALANTNAFIKAQLANTNSYIATKAPWSAITSTNTALRTLISDRLQVANATTLFNDRLTVANSKTYLQVANAVSTYLTKSNPVVTGTLTPDTRIDWTAAGTGVPAFTTRSSGTKIVLYPTITGSQTDYALGIDSGTLWSSIPGYDSGQFFKWYGGTTEIGSLSGTGVLSVRSILNPNTSGLLAHTGRATISTNLNVSGNTVVSGLIANGTLGTANYVLKTNGTTTFWGESVGGGGSSSNGFSGILVGANVVVADSTTDRLTFVAGSGMAIAADPTTDTITFSSTGGSTTQYLQVANAVTLYTTKLNPTTSGILAHTGRVTVSTNLYVSGNTVLGDPAVATDRTVINGVLVANGNLSVAGNTTIGAVGKTVNSTGWFGVTGRATVSTNLFVGGNTIIKGLSANGTLGTANFVLKTNGTTTFWGAAAGGGGGVTLLDEVASATTHYPTMTTTSSGTWSAGRVSTTKLYFTPSTGQLNATIFNSLSDKRVKKNIKIVDDALNTVNDMRGVKFNWKETSTPSIGLIAQEVEKLLPELVHTGHNGEKSVNYGGVVGVLVEAIKELTKRIDKLEGK